jgi:hypothetical protein
MDDFLFDIPIYLRSPEEFENDRQDAENKMKELCGGEYAFGKKIDIKWPPWEYNDVIGYYKIIINSSANPGDHIKGIRVEKYIAKNKRIVRDPKKRKVNICTDDIWYHKQLPVYHNPEHDFKNTLLRVLDNLYDDVTNRKRKRY